MNRFLHILLFIVISSVAFAQEFTVKRFEATNDLTARDSRYLRNDLNGNPCALVKVQVALTGVEFEGNKIGDVQYKTSEYWVYLPAGDKRLKVKHPNYLPLTVMFADYGIERLEGKTTYVLTLTIPTSGGPVQQDDGLSYLAMTVHPANAVVEIDGEMKAVESDGSLMLRMPRGSHSYLVKSPGYAPKTSSFTLGNQRFSLDVSLVSTMANITIKSATSGSEIWINELKKGTTQWVGELMPGSYKIEAKKEGYVSWSNTFNFSESETRTVNIPELIARVGSLDVQCRPIDSEVYIDGMKVGVSPDMFRNITVGTHRVEIKKSGYNTLAKSITIVEGQTASITGNLEETSSVSSNTSISSSSNSSSVSGAQTFTVKGVSFTMIPVEGGTFTMGATSEQGSDAEIDEKPAHSVTLSSYMIGETEVTQGLWEAVMGKNPSNFKGSTKPVESVSWKDCQKFIEKLNKLTGKIFRLPTEAEWEYAARGGRKRQGYKYSGSDNLDDVAWYVSNSGSASHAVKTKRPNELGIYDMSGNVYEWCQDWYGKNYYSNSPSTNPTGPSSGSDRVFRGGSWFSVARRCRSAYRFSYAPVNRNDYLGLRLAL